MSLSEPAFEPTPAPPTTCAPIGALAAAVGVTRGAAGGADALAAFTALRTALLAFARTQQREHDGDPPGSVAPPGPREGGSAEREPSARRDAQEAARRELACAVGTYTRALRRDGLPLAHTLLAVEAGVRGDATAYLSNDVRDEVQRDAARSCLVAYYAP